MATTEPTAPTTKVAEPATMAATTLTATNPGPIRTFLKDHETLIIVVIVAVLIWFSYGKIATIIADHDNRTLQAQKLVTDAQAKADAQLAAQVKQDAANLAIVTAQKDAANAQLAQANATLSAALAARQKTDATLPLPDLAARWSVLVPGATLTATTSGLSINPAGAVATVVQLEQVPVLQTQLKNETTAKQNDDQMLVAANKSITDLNAQVAGVTKLDTDHQNQCKDEKKILVDEARKSKRRWFIVGYVAGFLSRQAIKTYTGI
jgi:Sec-independent protein translocase protein TatA